MAQEGRAQLKTYFEKGDKPTEQQFANLIDSCINIIDDGSSSTPDATTTVKGKSELIEDAELDSATPSDNTAIVPTESAITLGIRQLYRLWKKIFTVFYTKTEVDGSFERIQFNTSLNSNTSINTVFGTRYVKNTGGSSINLTPTGAGVTINGSTSSFVLPAGAYCLLKRDPADSTTYWAFIESTTSSVSSGDVVGPASATDNALARFDTTTGKLIQNSTASLDDLGNLTTAGITVSSATVSTPTFFDASKKLISATGVLLGAFWHTLTAKSTPVDADEIMVLDSSSSFEAKRTTLTQFKAFLKTYFDGVSVITITTGASSITTATTDSNSIAQNNRTVIIDNSTNAINFTLNGSVTASYIKHGTGTITILRGSGREMYVNGSNVASALFNGLVGSTMSIIQVGTRDYVNINNI